MPRRGWAIAVLLAAGPAGPAAGQLAPPPPVAGAPVHGSPVEPLAPTAPPALPPTAAANLLPPPVLGAPIGDEPSRPLPTVTTATTTGGALPPRPRATLVPPTAATPIPATVVEAPVRPAGGTAPADPVGDLLRRRGDAADPSDRDHRSAKFGDRLLGIFGEKEEWFKSDHAYDGFASPVTNPFLFEDPRSITEFRPLFIYQKLPSGQPDFTGGSATFFGAQGRVAITDRWSLTLNKLGGVWLRPGDGSPYASSSGFAEVWLGPKYTFWRDDTGVLAAAGLQFQVPVGQAKVFQNTGSLSVVPYLSYGQNFLKDWLFQGLNVMATTGYALGTSNARSDYWYISGHVDVPVRITDTVRLYPLAELNYFLYTKDGNTTPIGGEGRDLFNFGGQARGKGMLSGAIGARLKVTEALQFGGAFEIPLAGPKDLMQYRFTVDFIWRY